jgi:molecular chaperone GrpE
MSEPDASDPDSEEEPETEEEPEAVSAGDGQPSKSGDVDASQSQDGGGSQSEHGDGSPGADELEEVAREPDDADADRRLREIAAEAVEVADEGRDLEGIADPAEGAVEPADIEVDEELVDRVREADPSTIAVEIATLQFRAAALDGETAELREEVEDLESRLARKQADFQNYKERQQRKIEAEKRRATEDLVERLLDVRDNLQRALDQEEGADIRGGVETTLRQFDEEFDRENVAVVDPEPGTETDPQRHEVLMRVESAEPEDTVADVHRPGYEMGEKVLRPAQVTVSDGTGEGDAAGGDEGRDGD